MSIDAYDVYKMYVAVHNHFANNYDYIKYAGKSKVSRKSYEARNDKVAFSRLGRKYSKSDLLKFFIANNVDARCPWIGDMTEDVYVEWCKRTEAVEYYFKNHLDIIFNDVKSIIDFKKLFKVEDGQHPIIFEMLMQKMISIETFIILDDLYPFIEKIGPALQFRTIWDHHIVLIKKYRPFLKYGKRKVKQFMKDKMIELLDSNGKLT